MDEKVLRQKQSHTIAISMYDWNITTPQIITILIFDRIKVSIIYRLIPVPDIALLVFLCCFR